MSTFEISLEQSTGIFKPGETITGTASWELDQVPDWLELRLFWYTQGMGTQDVGVVDCVRLDAPAARGDHAFSFTAPKAPYSFSGSMVSILWAIELVPSKGDGSDREGITISPSGKEVVVSPLDK